MQEVSAEPQIEIPGPVRRDLPPVAADTADPRAQAGEGARYPGAHLLQVRGGQPGRIAQAEHRRTAGLLQQDEGTKRLATETGAGQWGSSLAMACAFFGLECKVFMVRVSYDQKPYRRALMELYGATVFASPSSETDAGRAILAAPRTRTARSASRSRRRSRSPSRTRDTLRPWERAESRLAAPDRHRDRDPGADGAGG